MRGSGYSRGHSGPAHRDTAGHRPETPAGVSPAERDRARLILREIKPVSARSRGMLNDGQHAAPPSDIDLAAITMGRPSSPPQRMTGSARQIPPASLRRASPAPGSSSTLLEAISGWGMMMSWRMKLRRSYGRVWSLASVPLRESSSTSPD